MKKTIIALCMISILIVSIGLVMAVSVKNQKLADEEKFDNSRYLIKSDNGVLKMMYGVRHNFDAGFTTDLSPGQLKVLEKFGVEVEQVQIYSITARPYCGDGKCHPAQEDADSCAIDCSTTPPPEPEPTRDCLPSNTMPWGIERVGGSSGGANVIVAVLDTGIDTNHLDLMENIIGDCVGFGYATCEDDNGHGTHVAGTIAANGGSDGLGIVGVAPEAKLMAIKVLDRRGMGYTDDIAAGIYYATNNKANIISMSLGGDTESSLIRDAIDYATDNGVLVIAAAGNSGPTLDSIIYPAANPKVVAVAAFDSSNTIALWSSRGINDGDWLIEAREIEFAAPGVSVLSTMNNGCYATGSGTSMATPHITGIAARNWQTNGTVTRTSLQKLAEDYTNYSIDYGLSGDDIEAGFGLPIAGS